ncbi:alpha/beta fold hydrolase [Jatrophihabitans sp. DSM 45814]
MPNPPVLLIHGVGSSFEHNWKATGWADLLESEGREVVAVHLPGHGPDPAFEPGDTAPQRILAAAGDGPIDAVGFSAGGHALLVAASQNPAAFRRIAVLGVGNPAPAIDGASAEAAEGNATEGGGGSDILDGLEADDEPTADVPRIIRRLVASAGNDRFAVAAFLRSGSTRLQLADVGQITMPTLVVLGDRDFAGPADQLVAALPQGRLVTLSGVDHFATPSNFGCIDAVLKFLDE